MRILLPLFILASISLGEWSYEKIQNFEGASSSLTISPDGNRHVSFSDTDLWYAFNCGTSWSVDVIGSGELVRYVSIATGPDNEPHIACCFKQYGFDPVALHKWCEGSGWESEAIDTSCAGNTSLLFNSDDVLCAGYIGADFSVRYAEDNWPQWNREVIESGQWSFGVELELTSSDVPMLAYCSEDLTLKLAVKNGSSWEIETIGAGHEFQCRRLGFALDSQDLPHIVCRRDSEAWYYHWNGSEWETAVLPGTGYHHSSFFSLVVDHEDRVHIGASDPGRYIYHNGSSWVAEQLEVYSPGSPALDIDLAGNPCAAVAEDYQGVTFATRTPLGLTPEHEDQFFRVHPNPASSALFVQVDTDLTGSLEVTLCDLSGRTVVREEYSRQDENASVELNVTGVPAGIYLCRVTGEDLSGYGMITVLR